MTIDARVAKRFVRALAEECLRQRQELRLPGFPRPYYVSYLLRDIHSIQVWGRLGNLNQVTVQDSRNLYCDCRVGSYRFDQVSEGGLDDHDPDSDTYDLLEMPTGNDVDALKYHVWKLTDGRYREAVRHYLQKKSQLLTFRDPGGGLQSFGQAPAKVDLRFEPSTPVDLDACKDFVARSSKVLKRHTRIKTSWVDFRIRDITRLFVNSEGSQLIDQIRICELACELWLLTPSGEGITTRIVHVTPELDQLPTVETFIKEITARVTLLNRLEHAATIKSYAGPVLLSPEPAGILFHEVLGHRLEGSRLLSTREGQTFKRDLGKQILPPWISVVDDPTLGESWGVRTVGGFRYDDEGSPGQPAMLVKNGKLVGFLSGRSPVSKERVLPNGHARAEHHERPVSRMANLVVEVQGGLSEQALKQKFVDEIKAQGVPFGIMILGAEGGETATDAYDFQAFLGQVTLAKQVWADGRENLVRNINFVGTPLSALRNMVAVGDTCRCQNAFCGAESGVVPVSTTSPAVLMKNLELQASDQRKFAPYVLPMPHERAAMPRRSKKRAARH
jgi:predicted Zn-dependent protease